MSEPWILLNPTIRASGRYAFRRGAHYPRCATSWWPGGELAGFAATLRTIELGLSVLVIEQDERLREIRDSARRKSSSQTTGPRADTNPFPPRGPLVMALHFDTL
jgi:hypothetical protein